MKMNYKENFTDTTGSNPFTSALGSFWSSAQEVYSKINDNNNCTPNTTCTTSIGNYGLYNNNCICISNQAVETEQTIEEEINYINEETNENNLQYDDTIKTNNVCYPNSTNFEKICDEMNDYYDSKKINHRYGVKKIVPCTPDTSKVICDLGYIYGKKYEDKSIITPCLNKTDDFDTWCRYYNKSSNVPRGYNVNSIGAREVLVGAKGGCFVNGKSDENSARAICDYNYMEEVTKLEPAFDTLKYNIYTKCLDTKRNSFIPECIDLTKDHTILATQIMGYDCNPGFARAKCIKRSDNHHFDDHFFDKSYKLHERKFDLKKKCDKCNS
jgi:hypothetical protein